MFLSQNQAKRFFIDKITAQARADSRRLSPSEEWMCGFSESDPEFSVDFSQLHDFEAEIGLQQYEAEIARLLRRRYWQDIRSGNHTFATYQAAYERLLEGDHYLTVIVEQALGAELRSSARSSLLLKWLLQVGLFVLLLVPAIVAVLMAAGLAVGLLAGQAESSSEGVAVILGALFLTACAYYLIRLWLKHRHRSNLVA